MFWKKGVFSGMIFVRRRQQTWKNLGGMLREPTTRWFSVQLVSSALSRRLSRNSRSSSMGSSTGCLPRCKCRIR